MARKGRGKGKRKKRRDDDSDSDSSDDSDVDSNDSESDSDSDSSDSDSSDSDSSGSDSGSGSDSDEDSSSGSDSSAADSSSVDDEGESTLDELAVRICKDLKEDNRTLVDLLLNEVGDYDTGMMLYKQTLRLEKGKGSMTADGKRRRTPGGTFLHLCSNRIGQKRYKELNKQCNKIKKLK